MTSILALCLALETSSSKMTTALWWLSTIAKEKPILESPSRLHQQMKLKNKTQKIRKRICSEMRKRQECSVDRQCLNAWKQKRKKEEEGRARGEAEIWRLSKLNTYSSWLNIPTLMSITWLFVYLGQRLGIACWRISFLVSTFKCVSRLVPSPTYFLTYFSLVTGFHMLSCK